MEELAPWLNRHEACFFDRSGSAEEDPWDHQFSLEYES